MAERRRLLRVYGRTDCPLCDELKDELQRRKIAFEERAITERLTWYTRYKERIPVVVQHDGREFDPPFAPPLLEHWQRLYG